MLQWLFFSVFIRLNNINNVEPYSHVNFQNFAAKWVKKGLAWALTQIVPFPNENKSQMLVVVTELFVRCEMQFREGNMAAIMLHADA